MDINSYNIPLSKGEKKRIRKFLDEDFSLENEKRVVNHYPMLNSSDVSAYVSRLRKLKRREKKKKRGKEMRKMMMGQSSPSLDDRYKEAMQYSRSKDLTVKSIPWSAIVFEDRRVLIYNSRCGGEFLLRRYKLIIGCKESRASFNKIKKLFVNRLPKVRAYMKYDFIIRLVSDLDIRNAITILKEADVNEEWGFDDSPIIIPSSYHEICQIDNEQILRALRRKKSKFLDFLVSKQELNRNVVPCRELLSYKDNCYEEDAFIFSIKSNLSNHEVLVLENVNVARATIAFVISKECYDRALRVVFDFIRSNELNKRQRLHYKRFDFSKSGVIGYISVNHSFIYEWMYKIERL